MRCRNSRIRPAIKNDSSAILSRAALRSCGGPWRTGRGSPNVSNPYLGARDRWHRTICSLQLRWQSPKVI